MQSICLRLLPLLFALGVVPAAAQDAGSSSPLGLSEIRGGIQYSGVELWTAFQPFEGHEQDRALDTISVDLLWTPPNGALLDYLGNPRVELGAHLSTLGRASIGHLALNWGTDLFGTPFFVDGIIGGSVTNSTLAHATLPDRNVGCPVLIYFGADLGYRIDEHWSVMGNAYHASHAGLCNLFVPDAKNDGLNGIGIKVGYRF